MLLFQKRNFLVFVERAVLRLVDVDTVDPTPGIKRTSSHYPPILQNATLPSYQSMNTFNVKKGIYFNRSIKQEDLYFLQAIYGIAKNTAIMMDHHVQNKELHACVFYVLS